MTKDGMFKKNSKENGQYHSNWLNMMMPRLYLAKNLLKQDGVIFISIDDNEIQNLTLLMNEIFGEENFIANIVWLNKEGGGSSDSKYFRVKREFIVCYGKSKESVEIIGTDISNRDRYKSEDEFVKERGPYYLQKLGMGSIQYSESLDYPIETPDGNQVYPKDNNSGKQACWRWSKEKLKWGLENGFIEIKKDSKDIWTVYTKQYLNCDNEGNKIERTQRPYSVIESYSSTQASKYLDRLGLKNYFDYTKPNELIQYLIERVTTEDEIILDFFSGSGTTADAVLRLNTKDGLKRKHIQVQLPELTQKDSIAYKDGFKTISEIGLKRVKLVADELRKDNTKIDLGLKVLKLSDSNFKQWQQITGKDKQALEEQMKLFVDPVAKNATTENMVYELMLKSGKDLNSTIEAKDGLRNQRNRTCFDIGKSQPRHHRCSNCQQATKSNCLRQTF
jgi:adenine-specific DNA-methyltransferase